MATLSRPIVEPSEVPDALLASSIPTPFPSGAERERLFGEQQLESGEPVAESVVLPENGEVQNFTTQLQAYQYAQEDVTSADVLVRGISRCSS
jgi:hypothetical protein